MLLCLDIGNTHTHVGLATEERITRVINVPTPSLGQPRTATALRRMVGRRSLRGAVVCSVVPSATGAAKRLVRRLFDIAPRQLTFRNVRGMGIDYPRPASIGADRLANALAARILYGGPVVVVDFGTAVTFDVVNAAGNYAGGIIAPGLALMTSYLHEKTALLPRIRIRETAAVIGRSTEEAMLVGAVHGYRGLIRELIVRLRRELGSARLPVIATGGYAALVAGRMREVKSVEPNLTLDGLRLVWAMWNGGVPGASE